MELNTASSPLPFKAFKGKSAFVTGHTGFKGSWLSLWLARLGAKVSGLALAPATQPNNFDSASVSQVLENHYEADIRDGDAVRRALAEARPDFIFHMAAQPL